MNHSITFKKWNCFARLKSYSNGRIAIQLLDNISNELIAVATINLPDQFLNSNEVFIKNWSENEGILKSLQQANIIGPVIESVETEFVKAQKCKLLI